MRIKCAELSAKQEFTKDWFYQSYFRIQKSERHFSAWRSSQEKWKKKKLKSGICWIVLLTPPHSTAANVFIETKLNYPSNMKHFWICKILRHVLLSIAKLSSLRRPTQLNKTAYLCHLIENKWVWYRNLT